MKLVIFAATKEKELTSELAILRDKVGLLHDAYSDLLIQYVYGVNLWS